MPNDRSRLPKKKSSVSAKSKGVTEKEVLNMASMIVGNYGRDLIRYGIIDPTGKTDKELDQEICDYLKCIAKDKSQPIFITIDHTPKLLYKAREHVKSKEYENACMFYALWFEHWLNGLIIAMCRRKEISEKEANQIIRDTDFSKKTTWLLRLLEIPPINNKHRIKMQKIVELRNAFVHYKWPGFDIDSDNNHEHKNALLDVEKTVQYFRNYERRHLFY